MGREITVTDTETDKMLNGVAVILDGLSLDKVYVPPKVSEICTEDSVEMLASEAKQNTSEVHNPSFVKDKTAPDRRVHPQHRTVPQPFALATEKRASGITRRAGIAPHTRIKSPTDARDITDSPKGSKVRKPLQFDDKKQHEEDSLSTASSYPQLRFSSVSLQFDDKKQHDEDNLSTASSNATSVRTTKSVKLKIATAAAAAPTFKSTERAEKRKEFYSKLEEKNQALEAERSQFEERKKEEEATRIKQLRKNMVFKANPVPSFYYEGPPPKPELKKLPLTRPKSPKLSCRKSRAVASNLSQVQE